MTVSSSTEAMSWRCGGKQCGGKLVGMVGVVGESLCVVVVPT